MDGVVHHGGVGEVEDGDLREAYKRELTDVFTAL